MAGIIQEGNSPQFTMLHQSRLLQASASQTNDTPVEGIVRRVRIVTLMRGSTKKKQVFRLYAGPLASMEFDP
jgi:hypothetical protein